MLRRQKAEQSTKQGGLASAVRTSTDTSLTIVMPARNQHRCDLRYWHRPVDLLVRTTLTEIAPGVRARSIVGRFLEHARVAAFAEGGRWAVYAGSLDAMPRNFDRRYELFFPVRDPRAKAAVLAELRAQLADDVNAFELLENGGQREVWGGKLNSQRADGHRTSLAAPRHAKRGKEPRRRKAGKVRSTLRSGGDQPRAASPVAR